MYAHTTKVTNAIANKGNKMGLKNTVQVLFRFSLILAELNALAQSQNVTTHRPGFKGRVGSHLMGCRQLFRHL